MHSRQQQGNQRNKLDGGMGISKDQNDAVLVMLLYVVMYLISHSLIRTKTSWFQMTCIIYRSWLLPFHVVAGSDE